MSNFDVASSSIGGIKGRLRPYVWSLRSGLRTIRFLFGRFERTCSVCGYRGRFFAYANPLALGINFDPSHAVRMGIDPVRMLWEFAPHVVHVHAKDTRVLDDGLYEHGNLQQATFATPSKFGAYWWRYTVPGKGEIPWSQLFVALTDSGYAGRISIELEDEEVEGEDAEREALIAARDFLAKT